MEFAAAARKAAATAAAAAAGAGGSGDVEASPLGASRVSSESDFDSSMMGSMEGLKIKK